MSIEVDMPRAKLLGVGLRALAIGALGYAAARLLVETELYATAAVLIAFAALVGAGIAQTLSQLGKRAEREATMLATDPVDVLRALAPAVGDAVNAARQAQARALERAEALIDTVPSALMVVSPEGHITFLNRAAREWIGEVVAHVRDVPVLQASAARLLAMKPGAAEVLLLADGAAVHVSCARYCVPNMPDERLFSLQRIAGELDAVEANAWSDMARVLAHEMMNSLTPIASLSESLEKLVPAEGAEAELGAALEVIRRRSHGLMNFVERYRTVMELPRPELAPIYLTAFVDDIERLLSATFRERSIRFTRRVHPVDLVIRADAELLEQALINLLRNAVEAVAGAPTADVRLDCEMTGDGVAITVADSGRGLPAALAGPEAAPFFSTKPGGGIGLGVARHIALAHGGKLLARSNQPTGAQFVLTLPSSP